MQNSGHRRATVQRLANPLLAIVAMLSVTNVLASENVGHISGRVTDPDGAAVSDAQITISDQSGHTACDTRSGPEGSFTCTLAGAGSYSVTVTAIQFAPVKTDVLVGPGSSAEVSLHLRSLAARRLAVTVVAQALAILSPDPAAQVFDHDKTLDASPGRPGAPMSIPGLPIETASGGIKAPQYFTPGVAGDHGEPIGQFLQVGGYLYPNNLPRTHMGTVIPTRTC